MIAIALSLLLVTITTKEVRTQSAAPSSVQVTSVSMSSVPPQQEQQQRGVDTAKVKPNPLETLLGLEKQEQLDTLIKLILTRLMEGFNLSSSLPSPRSNVNQGSSDAPTPQKSTSSSAVISPLSPEQTSQNNLSKNEICRLPRVEGMCRGYMPVFHFDDQAGVCRKFIYGGCGGNSNRFSTEAECMDFCGPPKPN